MNLLFSQRCWLLASRGLWTLVPKFKAWGKDSSDYSGAPSASPQPLNVLGVGCDPGIAGTACSNNLCEGPFPPALGTGYGPWLGHGVSPGETCLWLLGSREVTAHKGVESLAGRVVPWALTPGSWIIYFLTTDVCSKAPPRGVFCEQCYLPGLNEAGTWERLWASQVPTS